ncbi:MAG: nucleotidyltransferase domain-containing protein [Spirochaetales bacterium]|nr:nucleotidyltransferase domain-containing protein [Spirochaetales bacterium]
MGSDKGGALDLDSVTRVFAADPGVLAVYLLGSAVSGRLRTDSDVDLAVMPEPGHSFDASRMLELAAEATLELGRDVDPGVLSSSNLVYAREALLAGVRIFSRDDFRADLSAATLLGLYDRFQAERREVLDAFTA